jgi:hypothetical protein
MPYNHFSKVPMQRRNFLAASLAASALALAQTYNADALIPALTSLGLGPEGGQAGGRIVAQGTPEQIAANLLSHTGQWLARVL